ncbi:hypothetical protein [Pseudocolwellia agarivorans]|uniref:hypothetical protein n=1 Tax=Pseudocolwellia agarivorans TaxID=1911682 RepID=UPI0009842AED|nr:hypothetical protein [Pseudocolwellia agarivorans]
MSIYEITLLIHVLLFCYWIGADVGVFYSSKFVVDSTLSQETRLTAAKIMLGCDLLPRICMSLMLTVGGVLSHYLGIEHPMWQMIGIILLGPVWLTLVLVLHFKHNASFIPKLTAIDFYFRWIMIIGIIASCIYAYTTGRLDAAPWLIIKLLGFAFLIFCGLMIRVNLKGFVSTYIKLFSNSQTDEDNKLMVISLNKVKPWVITIWVVLIFEAAIGIAKPMF